MADNTYQSFSDALAAAAEIVARSTVAVYGRPHGPGSGVVWSAEGHIVTADHVVQRDEEISLALPDGQTAAATLVGRDPANDIALLKADASGLIPADWLAMDALKVGQLVLALGRTDPDGISTTLGVISALRKDRQGGRRRLEAYIQTDVLMYPGYSGGPLVAPGGKIAGLNSSALARGASLALPWETVSAVVTSLKEHGRVRRGYLGVSSHPIRLATSVAEKLGQTYGLILQNVEPDTPAHKSGLLQGDILVAIDGNAIEGMDDLQAVLGAGSVGQSVMVKVVRGGEIKELPVTVGERT